MKKRLPILSFGLSALLGGCAFVTDRTYLAEMEDDDSSLFEPREDFAVIPGDEGRVGRGPDDIRRRTPASTSELLHRREEAALARTLSRLEGEQSEAAFKHYQQHRARLATTSERIYFLQIPTERERNEYLASRGLLGTTQSLPQALGLAAAMGELVPDMSKDEVLESWGRPERIDIAGNAAYENERWLYRRDGAVKYIYFEGGRVGGWTTGSP